MAHKRIGIRVNDRLYQELLVLSEAYGVSESYIVLLALKLVGRDELKRILELRLNDV